MASYPDLADRVMIVNGFSKSAAMTGWRIGYLACNGELRRTAMKLFSHSISCTCGFTQKAALKALSCVKETEEMRRNYEERRNLLVQGFKEIPHAHLQQPDGAFYAWVRFDVEEDSSSFAERLLREAKIGGVPGSAYGAEDACYVRFTFAASKEVLSEMIKRLKTFMERY
jgi:aspartate aminotransferase